MRCNSRSWPRTERCGVGASREIALRPWLYTIARNRCLSELRARGEAAWSDSVLDEHPGADSPVVQVQRREELRELLADMQRLPADQRAALVLFELGDQSHAEIASVLGVRREKVKALIFQAREALVRGRNARERPCAEVRERLATVRERILPRSMTRAHINRCPSCAAYEAEVRRQRAAFARARAGGGGRHAKGIRAGVGVGWRWPSRGGRARSRRGWRRGRRYWDGGRWRRYRSRGRCDGWWQRTAAASGAAAATGGAAAAAGAGGAAGAGSLARGAGRTRDRRDPGRGGCDRPDGRGGRLRRRRRRRRIRPRRGREPRTWSRGTPRCPRDRPRGRSPTA